MQALTVKRSCPARIARAHSRLREEHGQSLFLLVGAMLAVIAMMAFAIDVATWYQRHHQAQVAADAAALAAANCMANAGITSDTFTNVCTSTSDTTDAQQVGTNYASTNGYTLSTATNVTVDTTQQQVTVSYPETPPPLFLHYLGLSPPTQTITAIANYTPPSSGACATPGNSCAAVFASDTNCGTGHYGIIFNGSGDTITGSVHSNGSINLSLGGNQALGPTTYGDGTGCRTALGGGSGDTFASGPTSETAIPTWPDDYSQVLTSCSSDGATKCTGPGGTPSYCTQAASSFIFGRGEVALVSGNVWCAYGSGTPSNPATWNGLIEFQSCTCGSASAPILGTWIAGTIDVDHNSFYLGTQAGTPDYPVFYALGTGTCSSSTSGGICMPGQDQVIDGSMFAPNGTIQFNGAGSTTYNFLEGKDINFVGGSASILGNGPTGDGSDSPGTDELAQ